MNNDGQVNECFCAIVDLALALGVTRIDLLSGCWTHRIDAQWWVAVNGHPGGMPASSPDGASAKVPFIVPGQHCYVEYNGWPAGLLNPFVGTLAAGEAANEDTFIAAIQAATVVAKAGGEDGKETTE